MLSESRRQRLAIDHILGSPHIGFFRLVGKEAQAKYRKLNNTNSGVDRGELIDEIIKAYTAAIDNKVPPMARKERRHKLSLIRNYANRQWEEKEMWELHHINESAKEQSLNNLNK